MSMWASGSTRWPSTASAPLTFSQPASIQSSASRREARPSAAMRLDRRSPSRASAAAPAAGGVAGCCASRVAACAARSACACASVGRGRGAPGRSGLCGAGAPGDFFNFSVAMVNRHWSMDVGPARGLSSSATPIHAAQTLASATLVLDGIAQSVADERIADADALRVRLGNESFHRMLRAGAAGAPAVEVAAIADDRGNVVNYSRVYPPKPINVMDREYFAVYSGPAPPPGAWVSAPVRNRTNGKWTFYIGRRIDAPGGRFLGLVVVGLTSEYFAQFYEALALGASTDLRLYRDDLTLLATAPEHRELLGRRAVSGGVWQIIAQRKLT